MDMPIDYNKLPDYLRVDREKNPSIVLVQNKKISDQIDVILEGRKPITIIDIIPYGVLQKGLEEERRVTPKFDCDRIPPDWNIPKPDSGIGYVVEQSTDDGYVVRITDSDKNKRANRWDILDQYGNILTSAWRNDGSSRTLYGSALPGTALGLGSPRPTTDFDWESLDVILEDPGKHGFKVVKR